MSKFIGKSMLDAEVFADFIEKKIHVSYGIIDVEHPSMLRELLNGFILLISIPFLIFATIAVHKWHLLPEKYTDQYLTAFNNFWIILTGYHYETFEAPHTTTSIEVHSNNNLLFEYELTEDFETKCTGFSLEEKARTLVLGGKEYQRSGGWVFTLFFESPPQSGTAKIKYL